MLPLKQIILSLGIIIILQPTFAQKPNLMSRWSYNSAYIMGKGSFECGIFQPFRYGISSKIEVYGNILEMALIPNIAVKINCNETKGVHLAGQFGLDYNTPMFNVFSRKGTGGILSPQFTYPNMFSLNGTFLATKQIFDTAFVTAGAGIIIGMRDNYLDPLSTIDLPIFYPRLAHLFNKYTLKVGADIIGKITSRFSYGADFQFYIIPIKGNNLFIEHSGTVMYILGKNTRIKGGYKICYGEYPFGKQWNILPIVDFVFGT